MASYGTCHTSTPIPESLEAPLDPFEASKRGLQLILKKKLNCFYLGELGPRPLFSRKTHSNNQIWLHSMILMAEMG